MLGNSAEMFVGMTRFNNLVILLDEFPYITDFFDIFNLPKILEVVKY